MRVLILGATGHVGFPTAQAFVKAGHTVYGLTRSEAKVKDLEAAEVIPIVGVPQKPDSWIEIIRDLDVIVDAVGSESAQELAPILLEATKKAIAKYRPPTADKIGYIYISGGMVYAPEKVYRTDTTPIHVKGAFAAWRVDHDQLIINEPLFNGVVIRPSMIYGYGGSFIAQLIYQPAWKGETVRWPGKPGNLVSTIHTDDLAQLIFLAAEKNSIVAGKIFLGVNEQMESVEEILRSAVKVTGAPGYEIYAPTNEWEESLAGDLWFRPYLGKALLGWTPRKPSLADGMAIYVKSALAASKQ